MYDFIMTERQHKILIIIVHHTEAKLILVKFSFHRVKLEIIQRVMHPPHHPFHSKTQSVGKRWFGDSGPISCFLGDRLDVGKIPEYSLIKIFNEINSFQIAIPPMFIGLPFPFIP